MKNEMQKKIDVTIIIPVYNTEKYLDECLNSVLKQTLQEIEVICVNDGSTDGSAEVLDKYAEKDDRVQIITQNNRGLSEARNAGMDKARGEYCIFLDSDDFLAPDALEKLYFEALRMKSDILLFSAWNCMDGPSSPEIDVNRSNRYFDRYITFKDLSGPDAFAVLEKNEALCVMVGVQLIKLDFLKRSQIRFYPGIVHEDELYTVQILLNAEHVCCINKKFYTRRIHLGSITRQKNYLPYLHGIVVVYCRFMNMLSDWKFKDSSAVILRHRISTFILPVIYADMGHLSQTELDCAEQSFADDQRLLYHDLLAEYQRQKKIGEKSALRLIRDFWSSCRQHELGCFTRKMLLHVKCYWDVFIYGIAVRKLLRFL